MYNMHWQLYHVYELPSSSCKSGFCLPLQLMVAPLQKLTPKANATIKDIGSIDSLVQSFGPYITGMFFPIAAYNPYQSLDLCVCTCSQGCYDHHAVLLKMLLWSEGLSACLQAQILKMRMLFQRIYWMLTAAHTTSMSHMPHMGPMGHIKLPEPPLRSDLCCCFSMPPAAYVFQRLFNVEIDEL